MVDLQAALGQPGEPPEEAIVRKSSLQVVHGGDPNGLIRLLVWPNVAIEVETEKPSATIGLLRRILLLAGPTG